MKNFTFDIPTSGHDFSGFTRYEIILTVTDSDGLTHRSSVFVFPDKVTQTFDTVPSGLTLEIDGISKTTPFSIEEVKGFQHTLNAPAQTSGGTSYAFGSWSDGGTQSHTIVTPNANQSYVATFQATAGPSPVAAYGFEEGQGRRWWIPRVRTMGRSMARHGRRRAASAAPCRSTGQATSSTSGILCRCGSRGA